MMSWQDEWHKALRAQFELTLDMLAIMQAELQKTHDELRRHRAIRELERLVEAYSRTSRPAPCPFGCPWPDPRPVGAEDVLPVAVPGLPR